MAIFLSCFAVILYFWFLCVYDVTYVIGWSCDLVGGFVLLLRLRDWFCGDLLGGWWCGMRLDGALVGVCVGNVSVAVGLDYDRFYSFRILESLMPLYWLLMIYFCR